MDYATTYHIGNHPSPATAETAKAAPPVGRVRPLAATAKRCKRDTKGQTQIRTHSHAANAFLKCSFLPKLKATKTTQPCGKSEKTERDFYQSLSQLAAHYGIKPIPSIQYGYPYNIALALYDIEQQLRQKITDWQQLRVIQKGNSTFLASEECYSTGANLYYIPIVPLYRLSKKNGRRQATQLLLSVCAYLYHIADIPYYRQESSYLYWMYEMVAEWALCDAYNEDTATYQSEIRQAECIGDFMERKIYNRHHLEHFKDRLNTFKSRDGFDSDCFLLATSVYELYQQYPNATYDRNTGMHTDEQDYDNMIPIHKYVSFCADANGLLFDSLFESVNMEFQEYVQTQEPVIIKRFDGKDISSNTLDFEKRLFGIIGELSYLLNSV